VSGWNRTQWELTVLNASLPHRTVSTALALAACADPESGRAFPGERKLAAISRQSRSAVYAHLHSLVDAGLIERDPGVSATRAAGYRLVLPERSL
jgi:DNA-binding MarR family transcriptional regulator